MTILTPQLLEETARTVWGDDWIAVLSGRLHLARKTLRRYANGDRAMPKEFRTAFDRMVEDQLAAVANCFQRMRERSGDEF